MGWNLPKPVFRQQTRFRGRFHGCEAASTGLKFDMRMTPDQIVEEASHLPPEQMAEVVDRLMLALDASLEPEIEIAWKQETRRRLAELESGGVQAIPGGAVSERIRKIVGR